MICPECGASWAGNPTCQECFHQMLFWEAEDPPLGVVHHLMVLCYHLQHPSLMSAEGLANQIRLLADFVEGGVTPAEVRRTSRPQVDSGKRTWKITARPGDTGRHEPPVVWQMLAVDVVAAGKDRYIESVRRWAEQTHAALRRSQGG